MGNEPRQMQPITFLAETEGASRTHPAYHQDSTPKPAFSDYVRKEKPVKEVTEDQLALRRYAKGETTTEPVPAASAVEDFLDDIPEF